MEQKQRKKTKAERIADLMRMIQLPIDEYMAKITEILHEHEKEV